jgi:hypothetical protein
MANWRSSDDYPYLNDLGADCCIAGRPGPGIGPAVPGFPINTFNRLWQARRSPLFLRYSTPVPI